MPAAIHISNGIIRDYPLNVINHRVLGKDLELYVEDGVEEDKTVIDKRVYKKKSETPVEDVTDTEESVVTIFKAGR